MRRALVVLALVSSLVAARPGPARADLGGSIYDDVRDVVEELIRSEVSVSVVRQIRERSPAVGFYFSDTLQRLASPYWGSLPRVFREDLTEAVADFVYFHLTSGRDQADVEGSLARFFKCVAFSGEPGADCDRLRGAVLTDHHTLIEKECVRQPPKPARRVACDLGLATADALAGKGSARRHVMDAVADLVLADVDGPLAPRLREILLAWLDHPDQLPTQLIEALSVPDLLDALGGRALARCGDAAALRSYLEHPDGATGWVCFAISAPALPAAAAMKVTVTEGGQTASEALPFWRLAALIAPISEADFGDNALYGALAEAALDVHCKGAARSDTLAKAWPCAGKRLTPGATVELSWLGLALVAHVDTDGKLRGEQPKELARWMRRWQRVVATLDRIADALPPGLRPLLFVADTGRPESVLALRATVLMTRLAGTIKDRWYLWSNEARDAGELDIGELLALTRDAVASMPLLEQDLKEELGGGGEGANLGLGLDLEIDRDLSDWFRLIVKRDHRTLAIELLRAGLDLAGDHAGGAKERFFISLAAYVLDASDGDAEAMTRSAFRAAAKDLLLSVQTQGLPQARSRWRARLLPRLGLRFAVADDHATSGGDRRRTVVSADWPTAMVALSDYAGLEASLLDPIAPLAELGLRDAGTFEHESRLLLDVVRPRLGVWVGVPQLSRRLALDLGVGARLVGVDRTSPLDQPLRATYVRRTSLTLDLGVELVF